MNKKNIKYLINFPLMIILGLLSSLIFNIFIASGNFFALGTTGIAQLIYHLINYKINLSIIILLLNIPLLIFGFFFVNKIFLFKTMLYILSFSIGLDIFPIINLTPHNEIISLIVGGFLYGTLQGFSLRKGGSSGGLDIIGTAISNENINWSNGKLNFIMNIVLLTIIALAIDIEKSLFSSVLAFFIYQGADKTNTYSIQYEITVISNEKDRLINFIDHELNRGSNILVVQGGHSNMKKWMITTILSKQQFIILKNFLKMNNLEYFINVKKVEHIIGNFKKKQIH